MIPPFKPTLGIAEWLAALRPGREDVPAFERAFASSFGAAHAISYPYGRSGLWAILTALGIEGMEVVLPAYTCSVVAHAVVLSGNVPRFVDIDARDFTMDLDQVEGVLSEKTACLVATHLFGYPMDLDRLEAVVGSSERRIGRRIRVIHDCAHSFAARWRDRPVCSAGDAALFGLNVSKTLTSIFGGMVTTDDVDLAAALRAHRDARFAQPGLTKSLRRLLYLAAVMPAFHDTGYAAVSWLQEHSSLLDGFTRAYHRDGEIHFPPDYLDRLTGVEARVGRLQLERYPRIVAEQRESAAFYAQALAGVEGIELPPLVDGATYSHYVVRVPNRPALLADARRHGVQLGEVIQYSVPHLEAYHRFADGQEFPVALSCSRRAVNLPVQAGLTTGERVRVAEVVASCAGS